MFARLKMAIVRVANTTEEDLPLLSTLERSLLPLLSASSFLYSYILALRRKLYQSGILKQTRLPLPVVSVGNISWGGNGKTPMVEFLAWKFLECGIPPLILTRGYGSGDEVRLLESHLQGTQAIIGAGSDRVKVAKAILSEHGVRDLDLSKFGSNYLAQPLKGAVDCKIGITEHNDGIGLILMDDGMQHWKIRRNIDIVMVNAISSFGNGRLLPRGPLREPLEVLCRADIAVIHHSNLVSHTKVNALKQMLRLFLPASAGIFCSQMVPYSLGHIPRESSSYLGKDQGQERSNSSAPLSSLKNCRVLCVSGIGCPESLSRTLEQLGVIFIDRMDFPDHHLFKVKDLTAIKERLHELKTKLKDYPVIVSTEKDYARSPDFFWRLEDYDVYILRSRLEIIDDSSAVLDFTNLIALNLASRR